MAVLFIIHIHAHYSKLPSILIHYFLPDKCISNLHLPENEENTFDGDHFWWTLNRLEAGYFYFHVLQQNSVYNVCTCMSQ